MLKDETGKEFEVLEQKTQQWTNHLAGGVQQSVKEVSKFKQEIDELGNAITTSAGKTKESITKFDVAEKKSQDEYVNSWTAKIKEIENRNKLEIKIDKATEKQEQDEYVRSWTAKIKEIEERNKLQLKLETFQDRMLGGDGSKGELDILGSKYGSKIDSTKIEHLRDQVKGLTADMPNLDNEMKKITQSTNLLTKKRLKVVQC